MTTPNGKHEFEAGIRLLRQYVDDATGAEKSCREDGFVEQADGYLAWIDDGTRAIAALQEYPKVKRTLDYQTNELENTKDRVRKLKAEVAGLRKMDHLPHFPDAG